MGNTLNSFLTGAEWVILGYFILVNTFYLVLFVSAALELLRHTRSVRGESRWRVLSSEVAPRISVLAPAYNEEATIGESLPALLALYYPNLEVIVINDGSRDDTLGVMLAQFNLTPIRPISRAPGRPLFRTGSVSFFQVTPPSLDRNNPLPGPPLRKCHGWRR